MTTTVDEHSPAAADPFADYLRRELIERLRCLAPDDGSHQPLPGLSVRRSSSPTEISRGVSSTVFCVIAQGRKETWFGDRRYPYDPAQFLVVSEVMPFATRIIQGTPEEPFLGLAINLDPIVVGSVVAEASCPQEPPRQGVAAAGASSLGVDLLDATLRLVRLAESPEEAAFLTPSIRRELVFRLLRTPQGHQVRRIASLGGDENRIAHAISRLRADFERVLRIDELADEVGMSVSSLHYHFKQTTAMSPLQYQKQLRLQEARRLMFGQNLDATTAGARVGYDNASQFSREYKRLFGAPPMRDVERLRSSKAETAEV